MRMNTKLMGLAASAAATLFLSGCFDNPSTEVSKKKISIDWASVDNWPENVPDVTNATPNPEMTTTVLILDDSGSMGGDFKAAKESVVATVKGMNDVGQVGIIGLNSGVILPITEISEAKASVASALAPINADGGTPLGSSLLLAQGMIEKAAGYERGFGKYQIIVTTDGEASDGSLMEQTVVKILGKTPIQISTIGLGIGTGHPLNMPGATNYAAVGNVSELSKALQSVTAAENDTFDPLTSFEKVN